MKYMIAENPEFDLYPLFSSPILKVKEKFNMTENMKSYISNLNMLENNDNIISENKDILNTDNNFKDLNDYITRWLNFYVFDVLKCKDVSFYITQSWFSITRKNQNHHDHAHPNSIVSGVFHLNDNLSSIEFFRMGELFDMRLNHQNYNIYNSTSWAFPTEKNTLFLFPSKLNHRVLKNIDNEERISLSFNTFVKGTVGTKETSDLLCLK